MQGLWSLIGKSGQGPGKDFLYDVNEKVSSTSDDKSVWSLHHGKKRTSGELASVFVCDAKSSSPDEFLLAKTAYKRLRTLRHPNIIKFLDGFESESLIYMVTEPVIPLIMFLDEDDGRNSNLLSWGLHQITTGIIFLVDDCKLIHENINIFSIFVGLDGEWKLGGFEYMHPESDDPVRKIPLLSCYDSPEGKQHKKKVQGSTDSWGLGCLIWEIYNGALHSPTDLKVISNIPKPLVVHYGGLVSANPKSRTRPIQFLENTTKPGQFLNNDFIKANLFLLEIQIKNEVEQKQFYSTLDKSLDSFPKLFCVHKVLPQLLNAFQFGSAGSSILSPLFKVGLLLDETAYQAKILPCIIKLFSSNDRATRIQLLQQLDMFVKHLQPSVVDNQIFSCVATGFGDTLPAMREQTVKAMLLLAPKLSEKTITNQLLRYFAKLQMDEQPGIRTNTTICLGKIAVHLSRATRQKMLAPAFIRALRDPFPPARTAGITAISSTREYYSMQDVATKLLPALCACTIDSEKNVRDCAFRVIKSFTEKLEEYSSDPNSALNNEEVASREAEANGSSWTGWAVSSFTSRFYQPQHSQEKAKPLEDSKSQTQKDQKSFEESKEQDRSQDDVAKIEQDVWTCGDVTGTFEANQVCVNSHLQDRHDNDSDSDYGGDDWGAGDWGEVGYEAEIQSAVTKKEKSIEDALIEDLLGGAKPVEKMRVHEGKSAAKLFPYEAETVQSNKNETGWDGDLSWDDQQDDWNIEKESDNQKSELARKREERRNQRELANKEKRARSARGALKLGGVKKTTAS